ncbi:MAG: ThiF family adenylyltransferase [Prevotellaceae bacterium]|nr:ThiF family adenylyltransferase [Prevotellaceae bacterium]
MSQLLISLNKQLQNLQNEGYDIEVRDAYLLVHHVPYYNSSKQIKQGVLAMAISTSGNTILPPSDHTALWQGEKPCFPDGSEVPSLINCQRKVNLGNGLYTDYYCSRKPEANGGKYIDFYEKVTGYYHCISDPVCTTDKEAFLKTKSPILVEDESSPLVYQDTNASRADIVGVNEVMKDKKIAIVGLGGTGSFLLDHLGKTCIAEIHLFDDDVFETHNAFRAPGAPSEEDLKQRKMKVEYLHEIYSRMHKNIIPHSTKITPSNLSLLADMDCVFICVDKVGVRCMIAEYLENNNKLFIDSGMGIEKDMDSLFGQIRVTTGYQNNYSHIKEVFGDSTKDDDVYASNIQVSELNCLAAVMMIMKWKRIIGFYVNDTTHDLNCVYNTATNNIFHYMDYEEN